MTWSDVLAVLAASATIYGVFAFLRSRSREDAAESVEDLLVRAEELLARQEYAAVLEVARRALSHARKHAIANEKQWIRGWYANGVAHRALREWQEGLTSLERVRTVNASGCEWYRANALEESAICAAHLGRRDTAHEALASAEELRRGWDPSTLVEHLATRGYVELMLGELGAAERSYREVLSRLGAKGGEGPYRERVHRSGALSSATVGVCDVHARLSEILYLTGRDTEATMELELARSALNRDHRDAPLVRARVLESWAADHERADLLESARELWREIAMDPGTDAPRALRALFSAAWCAWSAGDAQEAEVLLDRAIAESRAAQLQEAVCERARLAFALGDLEHGESLLAHLDDVEPASLDAWLWLARAAVYFDGDPDRALALAEVAAGAGDALSATNAALFAYWRGLLEQGRRWERAATAAIRPEDGLRARALLTATTALRLTLEGRFDEAARGWSSLQIPTFKPLLEASRAHDEGWRALERGDYEGAVEPLSRALELRPRGGNVRARLPVLVQLVEARWETDREAAARDVEEASALAARLPSNDPDLVGFLRAKAMLCLANDRPLEAVELTDRADALQRRWYGRHGLKQPLLSVIRARALAKVGRREDAVAEARRGLDAARHLHGAAHPTVARLERCLEEISHA